MSDESITESIKEVVKERLKNPLWGYIAFSWCVDLPLYFQTPVIT
ncbi:hypothetical protein JMT68AECX_JMT68AEC_02626 [Escherichia coli]|nr:hypothetical protein JMT68AECX_JMT68AEC_02626 [Escherichia coli]